MGAGQSIIECEEMQREGVLDISEVNKLFGKPGVKVFDFSPSYYKAYTDPDKIKKMREYYQEYLTKIESKNT
jgi:hypothetical protein